MERWKDCFVTTVTGLNRSNTGKEDDDKSIFIVRAFKCP
jgi:hypothetical protein